jgi:hypothetical protein
MDHADLALIQQLEKDPRWAQWVCEAFVKIRGGFFPSNYVSVITDRWGGSLTFGDVYFFLLVHRLLSFGRAVMTHVEVEAEPFGDRFVKENNELLGSLPRPFSGEFWGGSGDEDGYVRWGDPIRANAILVENSEKRETIPPGQAPLEVGYTNAYTTLRISNCVLLWLDGHMDRGQSPSSTSVTGGGTTA